jgi:hypothetical protein
MKNVISNEAIRVAEKTIKENKNEKTKNTFIKMELSDFISNYYKEILNIYQNKSITLEQRKFKDFGEIEYQFAMQILIRKVYSYIETINEVSA